jgi:SPP1 gp7 family putative phage head morphogenesis protein
VIKKKVRLVQRPAPLGTESKRAQTLKPSVSVGAAYARELQALTDEMYREAAEAVLAEYQETAAADAAQDFWSRLAERLASKFAAKATTLATGFLTRVERNATTNLERSLKSTSADLTLNMKNTPAVAKDIKKRIAYNVDLITRIPMEYLDKVKKDVNDSLSKGNGLADLQPALEERYGEAKRHAQLVALDQTRKAYTAINTAKMRQNGITKFEWVHSGGSQEPRPYHMHSPAQGGLNGGIFDINDPPVIDQKTGERGLPGDDYNCRCTMRPIVTFDDDEAEE